MPEQLVVHIPRNLFASKLNTQLLPKILVCVIQAQTFIATLFGQFILFCKNVLLHVTSTFVLLRKGQ